MKLATTEVTILDLLNNEISPLGCLFVGEMLPLSKLVVLKLDHNPFGSKGLENLSKGLCKNGVLTSVSMSYCNIDKDGVQYLQ